MQRLIGKQTVVTGGRKGIGRAIAEQFSNEGAKVLICGRGTRPSNLPDAIFWQQTNVANVADVALLGNWLKTHWGGLDILVNNAGMQIEKNVVDSTDDDWDALMGVNAKGVFNTCRAFIPIMHNGASIINIGSISGNIADPSMALYNASKAFVHGLTRSVAVDHGPKIRCNAICPGWIMTDMADAAFALCDNPENAMQDALARHPTGRFGQPEDVAALATWLASDESSFATGQCYTLDGGLSAASPLNTGLF